MKEIIYEIFCPYCGYVFNTTVESKTHICPNCGRQVEEEV